MQVLLPSDIEEKKSEFNQITIFLISDSLTICNGLGFNDPLAKQWLRNVRDSWLLDIREVKK